MPPRYAYWTILIGDEPTAFRAGALEDIMPTFNRLKEKQPTAILKWFQNGKLWTSRIEAREAMAYRGDKGRRRDPRQSGPSPKPSSFAQAPADRQAPGHEHHGWRGKPAIADGGGKPEWKPKSEARPEWKPKGAGKPEWKPSGFAKATADTRSAARPDWKPRSEGGKPAWKTPSRKPSAYAKASEDRQASSRERRPEWKPKASPRPSSSVTGRSDVRDKKWRPGGEHQDPRQKYKDAKKAKWTRFKQAIRARTGHKKKPE